MTDYRLEYFNSVRREARLMTENGKLRDRIKLLEAIHKDETVEQIKQKVEKDWKPNLSNPLEHKENKKPKSNFNKNLRRLRLKAGYTQRAFGKKLGVSQTAVSKLEVSFNKPHNPTIGRIMKVLNCTREELFHEC